jgi:lipopolysaccharide transport system permease protein
MYPMALLKEKLPSFGWLIEYNPLAYVIEASRFMLLNEGTISIFGITYTVTITILIFFSGLLIFNRTEKSFIDTV